MTGRELTNLQVLITTIKEELINNLKAGNMHFRSGEFYYEFNRMYVEGIEDMYKEVTKCLKRYKSLVKTEHGLGKHPVYEATKV